MIELYILLDYNINYYKSFMLFINNQRYLGTIYGMINEVKGVSLA